MMIPLLPLVTDQASGAAILGEVPLAGIERVVGGDPVRGHDAVHFGKLHLRAIAKGMLESRFAGVRRQGKNLYAGPRKFAFFPRLERSQHAAGLVGVDVFAELDQEAAADVRRRRILGGRLSLSLTLSLILILSLILSPARAGHRQKEQGQRQNTTAK